MGELDALPQQRTAGLSGAGEVAVPLGKVIAMTMPSARCPRRGNGDTQVSNVLQGARVKNYLMSRLRWWLAALVFAVPLAVAAQSADKPFSKEQLDQMTAQVALYPDSLLAQLFMATTYPDEFAKAYQWAKAHPDAKGDDAVKLVEGQDWDPSVASMVAFPEVLITLGEKQDWVRNMGDAFLAQPEDVMDSVQRLRQQAQKAGNLKSNEQIKVSTEAAPPPAAASTTVVVQQAAPATQYIVIQPAQPSVVYVPAYNPTVVYGPWLYPAYPPYYYPPPPGYWWSRTIATGVAWGVGIGVSNALWGGYNWGRHDVDINVNRYNNINVNKQLNVNSRNTTWNHNPEHRQTAYRGGDATRKNLEQKRDVGNRDQYRGKDASRDASREKAAKSMESRGVEMDKGSARDRAQTANRDGGAARAGAGNAGNVDRDAARAKAQTADRDATKQRAQSASNDNALKGAGDRQAKQEVDRGSASRQAAQQRPQAQPQRASSGGGASAAAARGGGAGGGAGGGGGGGARGGGGGGRR
jgi:hypothetical protein